MNNFMQKLQAFLVKPVSNGSSTFIGTYIVLFVVAFVMAVYFGWIKLKNFKGGW